MAACALLAGAAIAGCGRPNGECNGPLLVQGGDASSPPSSFCNPLPAGGCGPIVMAATDSGPSPAAGVGIWVALVSTDQRTLTLVWDRCPQVGPVLVREKNDVVEVGVEVPKSCGGDITGRQWVGATVTLSRPLAQRKVVNVAGAPSHECD